RVDGVKPVLLGAAVNQALLALTYGEGLRSGSWTPDKDDFTVEVGGVERNVSSLAMNGGVVELTLATAVASGDTGITVTYTPGARPVQDLVGNQADDLNDHPVTNTTGDSNTAPEVTGSAVLTTVENRTERWQLAATDSDDGDEVTGWAISGGADRNRFWLDEVRGDFGFSQAPDYETPLDQASPAGDNEYVVMVRVTSGAGSRALTAEREIQVSVQDEDEPPGKPEVSPVLEPTVDSLRVEWTEPDNRGSDITGYRVGYRKYGGSNFTEVQAGTGLTWTLTGLDDATLYEVRVQATNDEGAGPWSESVLGSTEASLTVEITSLEASPVAGPFTLRIAFSQAVTGFDSNDIQIQVETDCRDSGNNPLYCIPGRGTLRNHDFVRGISRQTFSLTLTPRTDDVAGNYTLGIRIAAGSALSYLGNQPNSEATLQMRVLTPAATAPEPISSLELEASAGTRSVMLSWNLPADNGGSAIVRYEYRYAAVGEGLGPWKSVGGEELGVTVGNLAGGREHIFEMRAVNGLGEGPIETVRATPLAGGGFGGGGGGGGGGLLFPPEAPTVLTALPGDEAVRLEWSPPESDGGSSIRRYEYRFKEGREEFAEWTPVPDSAPDEVNATGYTVGDLLNGTVYAFELRAVNAAGNGRVSEAVEVTMPLEPFHRSNFRAEDLEGVELMLEAFLLEGSSRDRELRFGEGLRFEEDELDGEGEVTATHVGSYGYRYTSRITGALSLEFDGGESCQLRMTFSGEGAGSYSYRCGGSSRGQGSFGMSELENRVPEITSLGPFEVEENRTRVAQLEAMDWDEEDEVTGYAIAGGVDGGQFTVEAETGELSFTEAPDYENPGDVESEDPASPAADNEYILVVEATSGEGDRERTREQAIRVRVIDVEMEDATEEEMEDGTGSLFVPVILTSTGRNNSFFTSELTLTNRGDEAVMLNYTYTSRDEPEERSGTASDRLPAGRQQIRTNALDYLRGLGVPIPETGNQVGTLRLEAPLGSEVRAVVRTTTVVPDGRAGLAYLGIAKEEGFTEPVYLCGLRQNSRDRSNVAFQNMGAPGEEAITLRTTIYSGDAGDATARILDDVTLEPGGFHQFSGLLGSVESGYVRVERVEGEAPFYAYGVINDQANSDGSFIFPVTAGSLEGKMSQTLPVIVETRDFTSELTVTNFSDEPRTLDFEFVSERIQGDEKVVGFSMTLEAGEQAIVPELVEALRREETAKLGRSRGFYLGALFVTAEEGDLSGVVIGARTSSEGGGGRYGVFYNAVPEGEDFDREAWVEGLQQNGENRSNLALVNTGEVNDSPSVFHLEIYNGET
ncbi:MAG: fibronectin type III domain-containing protein, partial [Acidobacteria bacterium]|nr:fibronectin type III domain-containing protein [Acidobacteriota bacterium]